MGNRAATSSKWHSSFSTVTLLSLQEFAFAEGSKDFCLVHLVTARTFLEKESLGLAYLSFKTWDETAGGICSKKETFSGRVAYINVLLSTSFAYSEQTTYPLITREIDIVVSHGEPNQISVEFSICLGFQNTGTRGEQTMTRLLKVTTRTLNSARRDIKTEEVSLWVRMHKMDMTRTMYSSLLAHDDLSERCWLTSGRVAFKKKWHRSVVTESLRMAKNATMVWKQIH